MGEILLWKKLRAGCMRGYTFNRQKPLGRYIVDFYCKRLNLVLEVDGGYHFEAAQLLKDKERQQLLEVKGLRFLRFADDEVKKDIEVVLRKIEEYIIAFEQQQIRRDRKEKRDMPVTKAY